MITESERRIRNLTKIAELQLKIKNELFKRGGIELVEEALKQAKPIDYVDFCLELRALEEVHPGFYCEIRKDAIFSEVKIFSYKYFRQAVLYFLGYSHKPPLVGEFLDYLFYMTFLPDLNSQSDKVRDLDFAFWSSRRWESMKQMHTGDHDQY